MSISLITVTGSRPEAFKLLEKYVSRQSYLKDSKEYMQWICIDDCIAKPTICTLGQEYYGNPLQAEGKFNTQRYGLDFALSKAKGDYIFILEDDDWYHKDYIAVYMDFLKHAFLVGEVNSIYYNVKNRTWKRNQNYRHASLAQTAFRKSSIPFFEKALHSGDKLFDITLWERKHQIKHILFSGMDLCVGIKGMPGRAGIGFGHTMTLADKDTLDDKDFFKLPELLGSIDDAKAYKGFYEER